MNIEFPESFIWGASTASYQIEGAIHEGGKSPSIWDTFSHTPGKIAGGHTGDEACDHYHRYPEDIALMTELGLDAYRFSTAWPRLFPEGRGKPNPAGRDFYDRLIDSLLAQGITPWLCFYHWDLPQALQDKGGWANRDIVDWYSDYAAFTAEHYGDRVQHFVMLNEANVISLMGHLLGIHAPGVQDLTAYAAAVHHLNLAQGTALTRLREMNSGWQLGTILNMQPSEPETDSEEDKGAADLFDAVWNGNFADPLFKGEYPELSQGMLSPHIQDGDMQRIQQPIDFLGLNLYSRNLIKADPRSLVGLAQATPPKDAELTEMGWEVYPKALYDQLLTLKEHYGNPPVFVTENGVAFKDTVNRQGEVHDPRRIRFFKRYLRAAHRALEEGVNLKGYFVWSLLDNFEWAEGYDKRFGLVYIDYETQQRIPKASFEWFRETIKNNGYDFSEE